MSFSIIAAVGKNLELGFRGGLIFRIPEDMKFFREKTMGHPVVMGRKTYESIGRELPGRKNIVVTRSQELPVRDGGAQPVVTGELASLRGRNPSKPSRTTLVVVRDLSFFIEENRTSEEEIFVIGGGEIYRKFLPYASKIYLTEVEAEAEADVFFPEFDKSRYVRTILGEGEHEGVKFQFVLYELDGEAR